MSSILASRSASLLGTYVLPGEAQDPLAALGQAAAAEQLGMGAVWLSERAMKEGGSVCGYLAASTARIGIGTSVTHFGTRHPLILASWGATMQALSRGRFAMGFGRSLPRRWKSYGVPVPTLASMEDTAVILRRLWAGETVSYDGPAGRFPNLRFEGHVRPPPLLLAAIGPKTLALAGRVFDGVLLHPFLTTHGVALSRAIVHEAARESGRDPATVRIYAQVVTAPDVTEAEFDVIVRERAGSYFRNPGLGDVLIEMNNWDRAPALRYREALHQIAPGSAQPLPRHRLLGPSRLLPDAWLTEGGAIGSAAHCAARLHAFLDAGADEVIVHGTLPDRMRPTMAAFCG